LTPQEHIHLQFLQVLPVCEQLQLVVAENQKVKILTAAVWQVQVADIVKKYSQLQADKPFQ
jgi:hypothetical protein